MGQYTIYHLHSDLSNGVTNIDSVTKYQEYIDAAKECGMASLGFSEHGSVFEWYHKKKSVEAAGMKYIHAAEVYLTATLDEKVRDNFHCVLAAKNYDGFLELNSLISKSFSRADGDNHFYYVPRISFEELFNTSKNILVTTACIGGVLGKSFENPNEYNTNAVQRFLDFLASNKDRCFLEIGHHPDQRQKEYNQYLNEYSKKTGLLLIAGTDTHVLNSSHEEGRSILQKAKNIHFDGEDGWDLKFKTYDELVAAYRRQAALPEKVFMEAIENTNLFADMIEPFQIDCSAKYPHIYDNPEETFKNKIETAIQTHPYARKNHTEDELRATAEKEFEVYKKANAIDFMLLQTYLREWEKKNGVECGYGRGSVSGSMVAYLLGITQMDSLRFGLNFFRFINPSRVTNADIDTDYSGEDRDRVKQFLLKDKLGLPNIKTSEIITFNTIVTKGAVRDICRALYKDRVDLNYKELSDKISKQIDAGEEETARSNYPEVFKYVDIVAGTIVSVGTHPSGVLISDMDIEKTVGLCSVSGSDYPVSMLNMKELDDLMYVKLDVLGLDAIGVINSACKILGVDRLGPDNIDLNDDNVWRSIRDDGTLIFQWESESAQRFLRKFMSDKTIEIAKSKIPNFSMIKWLSFGNGLIRPACASFRDNVANGEFYDNGFAELNDFLAPEAGRIAMQETIMKFLVQFCGYSDAESDNVRRAIAKKKGTETLLPEIEQRFVEYSSAHYDITPRRCEEVIKPFIKIILDASSYGFSWNHSDAYSIIGYICGYLRYYHPLEFLTAALNTFKDKPVKTAEITKYAKRHGIKIETPKWGYSRGDYFFNAEKKIIAKGIGSIKYMNSNIADELYNLSQSKKYESFMDVLDDMDKKTSIDARQIDTLIKLDYFSEFGNQRELLFMTDMYSGMFKKGEAKQIRRSAIAGTPLEEIVKKYAIGETKSGGISKSYTLFDVHSILLEVEKSVRLAQMPDIEDNVKIKNFYDIMGYYGYVSHKETDRRKLYVKDIRPLKRKSDGKQFGYSVYTQSIGSGKESRFTLLNSVYNTDPIRKDDIIYCISYEREGIYFKLSQYKKIYSMAY